jgi:hypothetical protein
MTRNLLCQSDDLRVAASHDLGGKGGVPAHQSLLLRCERTRLEEYLVGYDHFADVVHRRHAVDATDLFRGKAEVLSDHAAEPGYPSGVLPGRVIPQFDDAAELGEGLEMGDLQEFRRDQGGDPRPFAAVHETSHRPRALHATHHDTIRRPVHMPVPPKL